jgi:hypothetical protein
MAKKCARTFSIVVEKGKKSILDVGHLLPDALPRSVQEANDEIRSSLSLHFSHFCRPPTDSASHWRTKMAGAAVWVRGGAGAVVAQRA